MLLYRARTRTRTAPHRSSAVAARPRPPVETRVGARQRDKEREVCDSQCYIMTVRYSRLSSIFRLRIIRGEMGGGGGGGGGRDGEKRESPDPRFFTYIHITNTGWPMGFSVSHARRLLSRISTGSRGGRKVHLYLSAPPALCCDFRHDGLHAGRGGERDRYYVDRNASQTMRIGWTTCVHTYATYHVVS